MTACIRNIMNTFYPTCRDFCKETSSLINRVKQAVDRCFHSLEKLFRNCCKCFSPSRYSRSERAPFPTPAEPPPLFRPMPQRQYPPTFSQAHDPSYDLNEEPHDDSLPLSQYNSSIDLNERFPIDSPEFPQIFGVAFRLILLDVHNQQRLPIVETPTPPSRLLNSICSDPQYKEWKGLGTGISQILFNHGSDNIDEMFENEEVSFLDPVTYQLFRFPVRPNCCTAIFDQEVIRNLEVGSFSPSCPCCRRIWEPTTFKPTLAIDIQHRIRDKIRPLA